MRQVFRKIPVYTGDVSGVCSALFELGGMVVMHDPSGCNSTYNTHDEIRWYDHDSLIFLSGLNEHDAILGSDEKLIHDIAETANTYSPAFIAIANSPIPYITGMDFDAISRRIEEETGIPAFYISTNGMHDYTRGAGLAFLQLAKRVPDDSAQSKKLHDTASNPGDASPGSAERGRNNIRANILGMTPLDFAAPTTIATLRGKLESAGIETISCWAMEDPNAAIDRNSLLEGIRRSAAADVNLVLSATGLSAAEYMKNRYGIPYVAGIPAHGTEEIFFDAVRRAAETGENQFPFREREQIPVSEEQCPICLIGEPVVMTSLAASLQILTGAPASVFCMTEEGKNILGKNDFAPGGEEELNALLYKKVLGCRREKSEEDDRADDLRKEISSSSGIRVIADPCYEDAIPEGCTLVRLPHLAFSGRIFLREIPDLMGGSLQELF